MKPIPFAQTNIIFAQDQKEYQPLPACITEEGMVVSCWKLTDAELKQIQETGVLWVKQLSFGQPLQPLLPQTESPFE